MELVRGVWVVLIKHVTQLSTKTLRKISPLSLRKISPLSLQNILPLFLQNISLFTPENISRSLCLGHSRQVLPDLSQLGKLILILSLKGHRSVPFPWVSVQFFLYQFKRSYQSVKLLWPFLMFWHIRQEKTYFARKVFKLLSKKFDTKSIIISQQLAKTLKHQVKQKTLFLVSFCSRHCLCVISQGEGLIGKGNFNLLALDILPESQIFNHYFCVIFWYVLTLLDVQEGV